MGDSKDGKSGEKQDALSEARKKIRDRIAMAEEAKKLELQRHRIELAGKGVTSYSDKNMAEAAQSFKGYIKVLEDLKGVPNGGLSPQHFDRKEDIPEMMLLSGVYWDLIKLFDRTRSPEKYTEFKLYLGKYILFTKGMPYQTMASETMRKYIQANRPKHKKDFQAAYKQIAISKCFVATELVSYTDIDTIPALREFRDKVLKKRAAGRRFVAWYYRQGPKIAERISVAPEWMKRVMGRGLDHVARRVR